jgi:hypothetical protein
MTSFFFDKSKYPLSRIYTPIVIFLSWLNDGGEIDLNVVRWVVVKKRFDKIKNESRFANVFNYCN